MHSVLGFFYQVDIVVHFVPTCKGILMICRYGVWPMTRTLERPDNCIETVSIVHLVKLDLCQIGTFSITSVSGLL